MAITFITTAPNPGTYTPLADFQSQTPESLSDTEVLHYSSPAEIAFTPSAASQFQNPAIHVYVTSKLVTLWSEEEAKGLTIPYTNISLHAAQAPGSRGDNSRGCIYMQLDGAEHLMSGSTTNGNSHHAPEGEDDEDPIHFVELHIIPADESTSEFYEALCACASLHPDPNTEEEGMFGGGDWITSDQFDDAGSGDDKDDDETATDGNVAKWRRTE